MLSLDDATPEEWDKAASAARLVGLGEPPERRVIFLNGPPRAGKDTVGNTLSFQGAYPLKQAETLKQGVHALLGIPRAHDAYENCKDEPHASFFGMTPRQAYIHFSEEVMKPLFGDDVFGKILLRKMWMAESKLYVITDSGFREECVPIVEHYGAESCEVWQVYRPGCDFSNDSRGWLDMRDLGVKTFALANTRDVDYLCAQATALLKTPQLATPISLP